MAKKSPRRTPRRSLSVPLQNRLFRNDLKIYTYPLLDARTGALITAGNLRVGGLLGYRAARDESQAA